MEIITGDCDHCATRGVLVARLGFNQVAQLCRSCLETAAHTIKRVQYPREELVGGCPYPH